MKKIPARMSGNSRPVMRDILFYGVLPYIVVSALALFFVSCEVKCNGKATEKALFR